MFDRDNAEKINKVYQKWGFGMAPVKSDVQFLRQQQINIVLETLDKGLAATFSTEEILTAFSEVKGLLNRVLRSDQWDWFTVWYQLGLPEKETLRPAVSALVRLRVAFKYLERKNFEQARTALLDTEVIARLLLLIGDACPKILPGQGYIYALSTRESKTLFKVGYTTRDIFKRINEINRATGIVYPYSVRHVWVTPDARIQEKEIHQLLAKYRVRSDREFFQLDIKTLTTVVNGALEDKVN